MPYPCHCAWNHRFSCDRSRCLARQPWLPRTLPLKMTFAFSSKIKRSFKSVLLILAFLLASCSSNKSSWQCASLPSSPCKKLYLTPQNTFQNLEIVLQKDGEESKAMINVYGIPLKAERDGRTKLVLTLDGTSTCYSAYLLEGGQRIVLPNDAEQKLLEALYQKKPLELAAGRYSTKVCYEGFEEPFSEFQNEKPSFTLSSLL